jgi:hypothetical protein
VRRPTLLGLGIVLALAACGGGGDGGTGPSHTPRTDIPSELVGTWYQGSVSSTDYYDPGSGSWGTPSGTGVAYTFSGDGIYRHTGVIQSSLYGCSQVVIGWDKGTAAVDGAQLTLTSTSGRLKSEDNCAADNNYDKSIDIDQQVLTYRIGADDYGTETLWLTWPNGQSATFHRQQ